MEQENPLQSASYKVSSALARLGTDLRETAQSAALSSKNREKLFDASALIHQVFTEIVSGKNDGQKELEAVQNEGATLLGEKRYVFEAAPGQGYNETHVWVEQGGKRYELPKRDRYSGFSWGYRGSGPNTLAWALIEDCFGSENLPSSVQTDLHDRVYTLVVRAPGGKGYVLHEHQLRDCLSPDRG
jgi:hypothetical protein